MLTVDRVRELLGDNCPQSDEEVLALRDQLYRLADVAIEIYVARSRPATEEKQN